MHASWQLPSGPGWAPEHHEGVLLALDRPDGAAALTQWTVQPVAIVLIVLLAAWYLRGVARLGRPWPRGRVALFAAGLVLLGYASCGFPGVYASSLFWVWTSQTLALWLAVPIVLLFGQPLQLARELSGPGGRVERLIASGPARVVANPLVGPALVPILSFALFFGPVPGWAIATPAVGWLLQLVLLIVGALMVLPLVGLDEDVSSLAVGLSLAIGSFELVIDALPGIVLRLSTHLVNGWFDHRAVHAWSPNPLRDQQLAGNILWCIAELIDLPFLYLVFRRWLRADARDAARADAVLEAERAARAGLDTEPADAARDRPERDAPWWLSDPAMQRRLNRRE